MDEPESKSSGISPVADGIAKNRDLKRVASLVGDLFAVDAYYLHRDKLVLSLRYHFNREKSTTLLRERLELGGYRFEMSPGDNVLLLTIDPKPRLKIPRLNIILFVVTIVSVYLVPAYSFGWDYATGGGIVYAVALMSILVVHEMGHFIAGRRRDIVTSWPYFIPSPFLIGTFGAIIKSKSPFWNRRNLLEVGAAGPVFGWVVALGWLIYGLATAHQVPVVTGAPPDGVLVNFGDSALTWFLTHIIQGSPTPGYQFEWTEARFAGWVGLLVTAINMLPIGQLDGGHVLYGLFRRLQRPLGQLAMGALIILGFQASMWWLFAGLGLVFGVSHPPTLDDNKSPSRASKVLGWAALVILLLSFTPVPIEVVSP